MTLPPREINAYVLSDRADGRDARLFYMHLQRSQELKCSSQMKAYIGTKSPSGSSLAAHNAFRSFLAGVFVSVAFPETEEGRGEKGQEEGAGEDEMMSGGRQ